MEGQNHLDTTAIEMAAKAEQKIGSHEDMCSERYEVINGTMSDIKTTLNNGLSRIHGRVDRIMWGLMGGLGLLAMALLTFVIQWLANSNAN